MKNNPYISVKENNLLIIIASLIFFLSIVNFGSFLYEDYLNSLTRNKLDFSACSVLRINFIPHFRFLAILVFPIFLLDKRFIFFPFCTFLSFSAFIYEIYSIIPRLEQSDSKISLFEVMSYSLTQTDYFIFALIFLLLFWQISILFRIGIKTFQLKTEFLK